MKQQENTNSWKFVLTILIIVIAISAYSQSNKEIGLKDKWSVNANLGTSLYYGDVDNYRFFRVFDNNNDWRLGGGIYVQKGMNSWLSLRGQLFFGEIAGTKRSSKITFEGNVLETSVSAKADALKLFWPQLDKRWTVFATGGVGLVHWKSRLFEYPSNVPMEADENYTPDERKVGVVFPVGLGFDFKINDKWALNYESTARMVGSDELDGKKGGFVFDFYSYNFIGVTYSFDKKKPASKPYMPPTELTVEEIPIKQEVVEPDSAEIAQYKQKVEQERTLEDKLMDAEAESGLYKSPWPGVMFKVQIAASRKYVEPEVFAKKFNLNANNIQIQVADGWYRYSTGKHIKYWQAREYKNILLTNNNTKGAFVVAYRDDERIMLTDLVNMEPIIDGEFEIQKRPVVDIGYAVQILATKHTNPPIVAIKEMFGIEETIYKEFSEGFYHYTVGNLDSLEEAIELRDQIVYRGIKSAFIVGYLDGERIIDVDAE